jgi:hypothetical protein
MNVELEKIKKEKDLVIENLNKEKLSIHRTVENLSRENIQLCRDIEKCVDCISELKNQLDIIHSFKIEEVPSSPDKWKSLILERNYYAHLSKGMSKEIEVYKQNQQILLSKFDELKEKGLEISYEFSEINSSSMESSQLLRENLTSKKFSQL